MWSKCLLAAILLECIVIIHLLRGRCTNYRTSDKWKSQRVLLQKVPTLLVLTINLLERPTVSEALKDGAGVVRTGDQYLTADSDDTTTGAITPNNDGLTVGLSNNTKSFTNNDIPILINLQVKT